jgi:hypothetical protein
MSMRNRKRKLKMKSTDRPEWIKLLINNAERFEVQMQLRFPSYGRN